MIVADPSLIEEPVVGTEVGFDGPVLHFFNETLARLDPFGEWVQDNGRQSTMDPAVRFRKEYQLARPTGIGGLWRLREVQNILTSVGFRDGALDLWDVCPECAASGPGFHNVELCTGCNGSEEERQ